VEWEGCRNWKSQETGLRERPSREGKTFFDPEPALEAGFFIYGDCALVTQKLSWSATFIALGVALGFALSRIPNVELVTSIIFLSGFLLGPRKGFMVGLCTECIYSILNPYGAAALPLLAAQMLSMGITGFVGGLLGRRHPEEKRFFAFKCGTAGFFCTLLFDALTTFSFVPINHFSMKQLAASVAIGTWFYVAHLTSNSAIFAMLVPGLIRTAKTQLMR
jgi:uncharacterized membrane protein